MNSPSVPLFFFPLLFSPLFLLLSLFLLLLSAPSFLRSFSSHFHPFSRHELPTAMLGNTGNLDYNKASHGPSDSAALLPRNHPAANAPDEFPPILPRPHPCISDIGQVFVFSRCYPTSVSTDKQHRSINTAVWVKNHGSLDRWGPSRGPGWPQAYLLAWHRWSHIRPPPPRCTEMVIMDHDNGLRPKPLRTPRRAPPQEHHVARRPLAQQLCA